MVEPYELRVYYIYYSSGGMFVQSLKFIQKHQENPTTLKLAKMNLVIRSIDWKIMKTCRWYIQNWITQGFKPDFILVNSPFIYQIVDKKDYELI